jgi:hypothetical protein
VAGGGVVYRPAPDQRSDKLSQVTSNPDPIEGAPFLPPPQPGSVSPDAIAMALRDPELISATQATAGEAPYLPPSTPPQPHVSAPPVFDAKAMVDATKRKVANPVYGHMPAGTPESRAAADAARAKMRRKRRRNKVFGWVMAIVFIAVVGGVGYALYTTYQDDQKQQEEERQAEAAAEDAADEPGALTPLGEQAEVIEALDDVNSGARPSAGALVEAAEDAQAVVDQINGQPSTSANLALDDVMPSEIIAVAAELQPLDGFTRYLVDVDDAARAEPLSTPGWIIRLQELPQAPEGSPGLSVLPAVGTGEVAIALQIEGAQVTRLVVVGSVPDIRIDL